MLSALQSAGQLMSAPQQKTNRTVNLQQAGDASPAGASVAANGLGIDTEPRSFLGSAQQGAINKKPGRPAGQFESG